MAGKEVRNDGGIKRLCKERVEREGKESVEQIRFQIILTLGLFEYDALNGWMTPEVG